jgi:hypothetical protein
MRNRVKNISITASTGLAAALALLLLAMPARAVDPTFPTGSRVGLVPPGGMVMSKRFPGFEDPDNDAAIIFTTLPAAAYSEIEKTAVPDALKKQGISAEKREPVKLDFGEGFLITGKQVADKTQYRKWLLVAAASDVTVLVSVQVGEQSKAYPDSVVNAALTTLALRANVPDAERLSLLPFKVADLAGFSIESVLPGRALMLTDGSSGGLGSHLMVAALPGGPAEADDRANFAREAFDTIAGIKDVQITLSEPLRIGGQPGFQTMAQAKDSRSGADIMVVQWLEFGGGGFLQLIGVSGADTWTSVLTRLRTVRDSIELK